MQNQLVKPEDLGLPQAPTRNVGDIADALLFAQQRGAIVLAPVTKIDFVPMDHQVALRVMKFAEDDYYKVDGGKFAHLGSALASLAQLAGIETVSEKCGRLDDRSIPNYWHWRMTIKVRSFDGTWRELSFDKELDLRDGSAEASAMRSDNQRREARKHGNQLCQSKAWNRCIRKALGLRAYTGREAAQPFVIPVMIYSPDTSNPEIAKMLTASRLGIVADVYGAAPSQPKAIETTEHLAQERDAIDGDFKPVNDPTQRPSTGGGFGGGPPAHPDDDPNMQKQRASCIVCNIPLSKKRANRSLERFNDFYCEDHEPEGNR